MTDFAYLVLRGLCITRLMHRLGVAPKWITDRDQRGVQS